MASNGETGALLLAATACVHVDVYVCWRDWLLSSKGEEHTDQRIGEEHSREKS